MIITLTVIALLLVLAALRGVEDRPGLERIDASLAIPDPGHWMSR